jgi:hypothetical protein
MRKEKKSEKQITQYDKIFKENMEAAWPGIMKHLLRIDAVHTEELPDSIQHTKEREPDVLKKITDRKGDSFVLQVEFQLTNEPEMVYRMAEYYIMLYRKYKLPIRQHVAYVGDRSLSMPDQLKLEHLQFRYSLLSLSSVDYHLFLQSERPEEKILALLGDFGGEDPRYVIENIAEQIKETSSGELEEKKYMKQMRILSQLRNLESENFAVMESITTFFKEENDFLYRRGMAKGEARGAEKNRREVVKTLLTQTDFTVARIAALVNVTEEFVERIAKRTK